jgi:hypothetical protein
MRDLIAGLVALLLLVAAASLATTLTVYRRRRARARDAERTAGRAIVAEIPTDDALVLFSEDARRFYYGSRTIDKASIAAVRLLINGATLAVHPPPGAAPADRSAPGLAPDLPPAEGLPRDRWDVAIDTAAGTVLVECGAIRERVSQELARGIYEAVRAAVRP